MTDPKHAEALIMALADLSPQQGRALRAALGRRFGSPEFGAVWHQLAALSAQVDADQHAAVDALELVLDDGELGGIVGPADTLDGAAYVPDVG